MKQTEKLFDIDAYCTEFDATVLSCEQVKVDGKDVLEVVLDKTMFFPEEGGQSPDKGTIEGLSVIDVQTKQGVITHTIEVSDHVIETGMTIHGIIDWKHRFNNMQQHSGEHIFSGLVHNQYGYDNVGFHLSDQIVTMDFNGVLTMEQASEIEYAANEIITKNIAIEVTYPSKEELVKLDYRSKIEIDGQVRIITIPGVDVCACCAPHVRQTGEIGMLKIMNMQNYKGGVRLSILCGFRALEDYRQRITVLSEVSNLLSSNLEALPEAINKLKTMNQTLKYEVVEAKKQYMESKVNGISKEQEHVFLYENNLDVQVMRTVINQLVSEHDGICGIFNENNDNGYQFIIGSSKQDARTALNMLKETFAVRGGGSAAMVQGSITATKEELEQACNKIGR